MPIFLSPGVFTREQDLSILPASVGALTPAFIGTSTKGPIQEPQLITNAQQYIDTFGPPTPDSYLGYAVLAYLEEGNRCYVQRVGVECAIGQDTALSDVCIDTSGARGAGWGRISVFSGIDYGQICTRIISATNPLNFHTAYVDPDLITYNDISLSSTDGPTDATLTFTDPNGYTGSIDDSYTILITSDVPATFAGSSLDGVTYEIVRNSDGETVATGTVVEVSNSGVSEEIDAGDGLVFTIDVTSGVLENQDTFTFQVRPNNTAFSFNVDQSGTMNEYIIATTGNDVTSYTTAAEFADYINVLITSGTFSENYKAIAQSDDTVCFRTTTAGESIQLSTTEGFALEVGQSLYVFDIPRSYLQSTNSGPYNITSENNRISIDVTGASEVVNLEFSLPAVLGTDTTALASGIHAGGIKSGVRYFKSYSMLTPGGDAQVFIETTSNNKFDQLFMQADLSHYKTLRFAEELDILYPYKRNYRTFNDSRVILPDAGVITPSSPLSCETAPTSDECAADSPYFENIVGWFVGVSAGTWINEYKLSIELFTDGEGNGSVAGRFKVIIEDSNNVLVESFEDVNFDTSSDRYIGNVINPGSKYGGVNGNPFVNWIARPSFLANDPINDASNYEIRIPGALNRTAFSGGADGIPTDPAFSTELDRYVIGNAARETGIYAFQNPEVYDITLLIIPGFTSGSVIGNGLQMCQSRADCMLIVDPPFGLRAKQVVDWHNGMLFSDLSNSLNSSYGALYTPWLKIFDQFSGEYIFIPPSGHVSAVYARTARDTESWFAPAGLRRGKLLTPIDTEVDFTQGERDLLYGSGNAVNAIANFPGDGITVFGQRTLQRRSTALDRVNVRLLLIYIKKNATRFLRQFLFEPNDAITRAQIVSVCNPFLSDIKARRGLTGYKVVCNETNNTPERIDRNELYVTFFLKPTRSVEFISLSLAILKTDASFTASEVLAAAQ